MQALTDYLAPVAALELWSRVRRLLPAYWAHQLGQVSGGINQELGTRVSGSYDPMDLLAEAVSYDMALDSLRRCHVRAYVLAMKDIEEPERKWSTLRGTGPCDIFHLTVHEGLQIFERAKTCIWQQVGQGCQGCELWER